MAPKALQTVELTTPGREQGQEEKVEWMEQLQAEQEPVEWWQAEQW